MNGFLAVDKPQGWTSFDVVAKLRRALGEKKLGHGGTLDPLATGVLPVFAGSATKAIPLLSSHEKSYTARVKTGIKTDTADITGRVVAQAAPVSPAEIESAAAGFVGRFSQTPPMYSAVSVGGARLYKLARAGIAAEVPSREVTVSRLRVYDFFDGCFSMDVDCAEGTYIRTLAEQICERAGTVGTVTELRRTRSGRFEIGGCLTLERILENIAAKGASSALCPVEELFSDLPELELDDNLSRLFLNGVRLDLERTGTAGYPDGQRFRAVCSGRFAAVAQKNKEDIIKLAGFGE